MKCNKKPIIKSLYESKALVSLLASSPKIIMDITIDWKAPNPSSEWTRFRDACLRLKKRGLVEGVMVKRKYPQKNKVRWIRKWKGYGLNLSKFTDLICRVLAAGSTYKLTLSDKKTLITLFKSETCRRFFQKKIETGIWEEEYVKDFVFRYIEDLFDALLRSPVEDEKELLATASKIQKTLLDNVPKSKDNEEEFDDEYNNFEEYDEKEF